MDEDFLLLDSFELPEGDGDNPQQDVEPDRPEQTERQRQDQERRAQQDAAISALHDTDWCVVHGYGHVDPRLWQERLSWRR